MSQLDREILFDNERFVIGVLQAVSAGSLVGAIGQFENLWTLIGDKPYLSFLSAELLALALAVFAAYAKHTYKIWDVKAEAARANRETGLVQGRRVKASIWLWTMRYAITASLFALLVGFMLFILYAWKNAV